MKPLLTSLYFNIFKIARYSSNIKIYGCQYQRTFEPFIAKVYELIRLKEDQAIKLQYFFAGKERLHLGIVIEMFMNYSG